MSESQENIIQQIKEQGDLVRKLKAAKESGEKGMGSNTCCVDFEKLDMHLSKCSYIGGYTPSKCDIDMIKRIGRKVDLKKYPYLKRWWHHMRSFSDSEIALFPSSVLNIPHSLTQSNSYEQKVCEMQCKRSMIFVGKK